MNDYWTPHGRCLQPLWSRYLRLAGVKWENRKRDYSILFNEITVPKWKKDQNGKKSIEGEKKVLMPIKFYNFKYSLLLKNMNWTQALDWCEQNCFEHGKPVYLPSKFQKRSYEDLLNL